MLIVELLCFIFIILYITIGIYSHIINPKALPNRIFLMLSFIFAGWTFAAFLRNIISTQEIVFIWKTISFMAWTIGSSGLLHFSLALINEKRMREHKQWLVYIYGPGIILLMILIINEFFILQQFNYHLVLIGPSLYYSIYVIIISVLLYQWGKISLKKREKIQSKLIVSALMITSFLILIYSLVMPKCLDFELPCMLPLFPMIWAAAIWIAITEYRLMTFRPDIAINEIMDNVLDIIILANPKGEIIEINKRGEEILKYKRSELVGELISKIIKKQNALITVFNELFSGQLKEYKDEVLFYCSNQMTIPVLFRISGVKDNLGEVIGIVIAAQDIRSEKEFMILSETDKLTQINNRLKIDEVLDYEIKRSHRNCCVFSVILIDVDYFKRINDNYGHPVGDKVLVKVADELKMNLRKSDTLGRWGGEEFLVILPNTTIEQGKSSAEKLREKIATATYDFNIKVTCSFGVTCFESDVNREEIIERADLALYRAKIKGRNRVEVEV